MSERLEIRTFGTLTLSFDGTPLQALDSHKTCGLLVYIASTQRTHSRELLADLFWEDRPQSQAMSDLRGAIYHLRRLLGPFLTITRETISMNPASNYWMDAQEFETLLRNAGRECLVIEQALRLYNGSFLEGFYVQSEGFDNWLRLERERLQLLATEGIDHLINCHLTKGNYSEGMRWVMRLLQMDRLREKTYRFLMELLWRLGEREAALTHYHVCQDVLSKELGIEPTIETRDLYERIRTGSPPTNFTPI